MNININIKKEESNPDYQQKVIEKIIELGGFNFDKYDEYSISHDNPDSNDDKFIISGILQIILKGIGLFGSNEDGYLCFNILPLISWKDIWDKIKDIEEITYEL
jgi:hypothetical protein